MLVYKTKPVGAYLLEKPSGEVSGLVTAAKTAAEADGVEIEYPEVLRHSPGGRHHTCGDALLSWVASIKASLFGHKRVRITVRCR